MTDPANYVPKTCRMGRHEMNIDDTIDPDERDENGNIVWTRSCSWCSYRDKISVEILP
jgi:hypothetical protein